MPQGAEHRILIVEDHVPVRRLIALWLRHHGFVALEAGHAAQALTLLRRHQHGIALAIIDVVGTNGLDLAAEMDREHHKTPILYISGYADSLAVQAIAWRSPDNLLIKPFHERVLVERVRRLLARAAHHRKADVPSEPTIELAGPGSTLQQSRSQESVEIGEVGIEPGITALE
jgi:DNA-binding response OmpR family regulator